jgi:para-nitrobenzyl esterase
VGINYRLGYLGFFAHPALARENGGGRLANFGLADQQAALRWIRRNAAALGGDPRNITIMGESAGGRSVLAHLASPSSRGLFDKAIVQSAFHMRQLDSRMQAEALGTSIARDLGLAPNAGADVLRAVPFNRLVELQKRRGLDDLRFGLSLDTATLPRLPHNVFAAAEGARVPLLIGFNSAEWTLMPGLKIEPAGLAARIRSTSPKAAEAYAGLDAEEAGRRFFQDAWFAAPARSIARHQARRAPAFLYLFDYEYEALEQQRNGLGHGEEIPLVFNSLERVPALRRLATERDRKTAEMALTCWANFARTGQPAGGTCPAWAPYSPRSDRLMLLGAVPKSVPVPERERLDTLEFTSSLGAR